MKDSGKKNILITRFSALGDIAMTIPTVYNACRANPDCNFFFLTRPHPASLFINAPENLTVIGVNLNRYKGVTGMARLASELVRKYNINLMIDLHDVLRTQLLRFFFFLRGIRSFHIIKGRKEKKRLTRRNNKVLLQLPSTTSRYDDTFRRAGINPAESFHSIFENLPDKKGNPKDFEQVSTPKKENEHWIAIAPFAKHKGKIYPLYLLEKVVEVLDKRKGEKIFIFGFGPEESEAIGKLSQKYKSVINMADIKLGIPGELSLLSHCDVMLSMDSANMHFASLVGLRAVSIWGATHPFTGFYGRGQNPADAIQLDMTCRPCSVFGDKPCFRGDYYCLAGITPRSIVQKLQTPSDKP